MVIREIAHVAHQEVVLHAGPGDADHIDFLKRVLTDGRCRHLAGNDHHRDRIHVGGGNTGHGIGRARTGGHDCDTDFTGRPRVSIGCVHRRLLMAHQNMLESGLLVNFVVDVEYSATGITEQVFNPFVPQATNHDLRTGQFHVCHGEIVLFFQKDSTLAIAPFPVKLAVRKQKKKKGSGQVQTPS
jgi:hypothetical protein